MHLATDFTQHYAAHNKKNPKQTRREPVIVIQLFILQLYQHYTHFALYCIPVVCCEAYRLLYPKDIHYTVCRLYILKIHNKDFSGIMLSLYQKC